MTLKLPESMPRGQWPPNKLLNKPTRMAVEQVVTRYLGRSWQVQNIMDFADFASHPALVLSDGSFSVFAKFSDAANGLEQFQIELAGLRLLAKHAGVLIPTPIDLITVDGGCIMLLEAVQAVEKTPDRWRDFGRTLARIHQVKGPEFGLETPGYFGPLYQDNTLMSDWPTFYAERRLRPWLRTAVDAGAVSLDTMRQVEKLITRLPDLCGPEIRPTLLHGDAQQNNFISTEKGTVVIDPAVYYGHPEIDLALIDYFQPVPDDVFSGYNEVATISPDFLERRELWRISAYLAVLTVSRYESFLEKLTAAVQKYL